MCRPIPSVRRSPPLQAQALNLPWFVNNVGSAFPQTRPVAGPKDPHRWESMSFQEEKKETEKKKSKWRAGKTQRGPGRRPERVCTGPGRPGGPEGSAEPQGKLSRPSLSF